MSDVLHSARKPYRTIRPRSGWQALHLAELWQFRDLLLTFAWRDVKLRYKQTALGVIWVVLQPLIAASIFAFVFGRVAKLPSDGVPYFLFAFAGLLGWNAFNSTLTKASTCLLQNAGLVSKVYFPRLLLPLSTVFSSLIDFGVALALMIILLIANHITPHIGILLLPVWLLLILMFASGIGLYTAALTVSFRDVQYIVPVATQFLLYASPVAYAASALAHIPASMRFVYFLNPLVGLLEAFRWSLLGVGTLSVEHILYSAVVSCVVFLLGAFGFKKMERQFADVI